MTENEISRIVFESGLKIHRKLGIGFYESVYETCLDYELKKSGLKVERQKPLSIKYEEIIVENAFKIDMIVEDKVLIELKAVEMLNNYFSAQLLNYLKLGNYKLGMILNFGSPLFKNGVKRVVNGLWNMLW